MELFMSELDTGEECLVTVRGDVDAASAPQLREMLSELAARGHADIIIDMEGVDFIDSSGIGVLMGAVLRAKSLGGGIELWGVNDSILQIFELLGIEQQFRIS